MVKLSPSCGHLWSTYLGGNDIDFGYGIVVDASGNVLVTGYTDSAGWTSGGYDTSFNGDADVFVVKLSPSGSHLWSTYLGGSTSDAGLDIAVDASGNVLVAGTTTSSGWTSGGYDTSHNGDNDAFVVKIGSMVGDLNGDGFVGGDDLDIVRANWGQNVTAGDLLAGDPSGDGFVGGDDLDIVRANWGQGTPKMPVAKDTSDTVMETTLDEEHLNTAVHGPRLPEAKRSPAVMGPQLAKAHDEALLALLPETRPNQNALLKLAWAREFERMRLRQMSNNASICKRPAHEALMFMES